MKHKSNKGKICGLLSIFLIVGFSCTISYANNKNSSPQKSYIASDGVKITDLGSYKNGHYTSGSYIILLKNAPATNYNGSLPNYPATFRANNRFNPKSMSVKKYTGMLEKLQQGIAKNLSIKLTIPILSCLTVLQAT